MDCPQARCFFVPLKLENQDQAEVQMGHNETQREAQLRLDELYQRIQSKLDD
jgi:hypothetical protein